MRRVVEVPRDEVDGAVDQRAEEEEDGVGAGADDGELVVGEPGQRPFARAHAESQVRLHFGQPGGGLVVDEVQRRLLVRFARSGTGSKKDLFHLERGGQDRWAFDIQGFVGPLHKHGQGAEDEAQGGEFQGGYRKALDGSADDLHNEPACLKAGQGLLEPVSLALVPDFLCA